MSIDGVSIEPFGESALLVRLGERVDPLLSARIQSLAAEVNRARESGDGRLGVAVAGYASLLVPFDPTIGDVSGVAAWLRNAIASNSAEAAVEDWPLIEIPVRYGGADGPDLDDVARRLGLTSHKVVEVHGSVTYRVYMLGFSPGFGYLGELPAALELPRRDTPRARVPAGSVAIAGRQTAVYPLPSPGGWHLIGRTDERLWDVSREPPARLSPGQTVRFVSA